MLKCLVYTTFLLMLSPGAFSQRLEVTGLTSEDKTDPLGITETHPLLGWKLLSGERDVVQTAYRILVASSPDVLAENTADVWDSRVRMSDSSIRVPYRGAPLVSAGVYYWKVMVWDNHGDSAWSRPASWQMGLLTPGDWDGASWIAYEKLADSARILPGDHYDKAKIRNDVLPLFRKEFRVTKHVTRATAFISGLGQFSLYLNGEKVGHEVLDPSWTQYDKEADYVTFDVTRQLKKGMNAMGVMLGNGFYYIPAVKIRYRKLMVEYGYPSLICLVRICYADGTTKDIITDRSWRTMRGPVVFSSVYGGEDFDARMEQPGWDKPGSRALPSLQEGSRIPYASSSISRPGRPTSSAPASGFLTWDRTRRRYPRSPSREEPKATRSESRRLRWWTRRGGYPSEAPAALRISPMYYAATAG
jgi:hypothetical protein